MSIRFVFNGLMLFTIMSICLYLFYITKTKDYTKKINSVWHKKDESYGGAERLLKVADEKIKCNQKNLRMTRARLGIFLMPSFDKSENLVELIISLEKHFCSTLSNIYVHYFVFTKSLTKMQKEFEIVDLNIQRDYTILQHMGQNFSENKIINRQA